MKDRKVEPHSGREYYSIINGTLALEARQIFLTDITYTKQFLAEDAQGKH